MQTPFWAKPSFVLSAIFFYLAVHFAVRMAMWHTLGVDDAEQALFAQHFLWKYRSPDPPLFTWLLVSLAKATGVDIVAISVLRYALLAIVFVLSYLTARRLIDDLRLAALSVYSFAAIYVFAYYSHHDLTHTTAMSAMLAVAWYVFVRLAASPRIGWYLALGAAVGLGLLGKWNFVMFAAALPIACLVRPQFRPLVFTWMSVPAIVVCAVIVLPTATAILLGGTEDPETFWTAVVGGGASHIARAMEGAWRLVRSALLYPQPLLPLALLVFALPLWRGLRSPAESVPNGPLRPDVAFLGWTMTISLALHLVLVFGFGVTKLSERLMQPPLFVLPIFLFMLVERDRPAARAVNAFALVLALLASGTLAARIAVYLRGADHCGTCRAMMPVEALATELRTAGFDGSGTILTEGFHVGGNMRVEFPAARVIDVTYPPSTWPVARGEGQCLLLWQERRDPAMSDASRRNLSSYLADRLNGEVDAPHRDGVASALMFGSNTRQYRLGYRLYERSVGDCR